MNPTNEDVKRAVAVAKTFQQQGYFAKAGAGDERGASYFARLVAAQVNPTGDPEDWGALRKTGSGFNVEGFADGAIVFGNDPDDRANVLKIVTQIGTTHAGIGDAVQERRESDIWSEPVPLPSSITAYLTGGGAPIPPQPPTPSFPYPDEPTAVLAFEKRVEKSYTSIHRKFPDENDPDAFRHFARYGYSCSKMAEPDAANKHIKELREELGAPAE